MLLLVCEVLPQSKACWGGAGQATKGVYSPIRGQLEALCQWQECQFIKMILKLSYKGRKATRCCFKLDGTEWFNTLSVLLNVARKQMLTQQRENCCRKHMKPQRSTTHEWWSVLCVNTKGGVFQSGLYSTCVCQWVSFICILNTVQDVNFK